MNKIVLGCLLCCLLSTALLGQDTYEAEIREHQSTLNKKYAKRKSSPLKKAERKKFKKLAGHNFFPIDKKYRIEAQFQRIENPSTIEMETSSDKMAIYDKYGIASFELEGQHFQLIVYQSHRTREMEAYKHYLFLPFTDRTTGEETYGAGRYIDLRIPEGDTIIIDFNKSYHPYCAYTTGYSCPVTPAENFLDISLEVGIRNLEVDLK